MVLESILTNFPEHYVPSLSEHPLICIPRVEIRFKVHF